jgi:hypothetical protein
MPSSEERRGRAWVRAAAGTDDAGSESTTSLSHGNRLLGTSKLLAIVGGLSAENLDRLLLHIRDWNTQSKHNLFAQQVIRSHRRQPVTTTWSSCFQATDFKRLFSSLASCLVSNRLCVLLIAVAVLHAEVAVTGVT